MVELTLFPFVNFSFFFPSSKIFETTFLNDLL